MEETYVVLVCARAPIGIFEGGGRGEGVGEGRASTLVVSYSGEGERLIAPCYCHGVGGEKREMELVACGAGRGGGGRGEGPHYDDADNEKHQRGVEKHGWVVDGKRGISGWEGEERGKKERGGEEVKEGCSRGFSVVFTAETQGTHRYKRRRNILKVEENIG